MKKKYIFVQFGDFPMTYQIKGGTMGWVVIVIPLLICFIMILVLCTDDKCRMGVYCWNYYCYFCIYLGEGKKFYVLTKLCEKKIHFLFSLGIFQ